MYCPKCKSKLYPIDEKYMKEHGVCSYCVTFNKVGNETKRYTANSGTTADLRSGLDSPTNQGRN